MMSTELKKADKLAIRTNICLKKLSKKLKIVDCHKCLI